MLKKGEYYKYNYNLSLFQFFTFGGTLNKGSLILQVYITFMLEYLSFPKCNLHRGVNEQWKKKNLEEGNHPSYI